LNMCLPVAPNKMNNEIDQVTASETGGRGSTGGGEPPDLQGLFPNVYRGGGPQGSGRSISVYRHAQIKFFGRERRRQNKFGSPKVIEGQTYKKTKKWAEPVSCVRSTRRDKPTPNRWLIDRRGPKGGFTQLSWRRDLSILQPI